MIDKLVIIGVGLIGGSFALALRKAGLVRHIAGVGRSRENVQRALKLGEIDEIATDIPSALKNAKIVFLAIPVGQTGEIMRRIAPYLDPDTIVTDAGSTKQDVITAARTHLEKHLESFVPGHPIAGAERSGAGAAHAGLFRDKNVILTPLNETGPEATSHVTELWQACGARVSLMSARRHDQILAAISHLPHVLAFALMHHICMRRMMRKMREIWTIRQAQAICCDLPAADFGILPVSRAVPPRCGATYASAIAKRLSAKLMLISANLQK